MATEGAEVDVSEPTGDGKDRRGSGRTRGRGRGRGGGRGRGQRPRAEENVDEAVDGNHDEANHYAEQGAEKSAPEREPFAKDEFKERVRQLLSEGPVTQVKFAPAWKKKFGSEFPLNYQAWGFQRLSSLLDSIPDVVERIPIEGSRDYTISLAGSHVSQHGPGIVAHNGGPQSVGDALAKMLSDGANGDVGAAERFLQQEELQFTIKTLTQAFKEYLRTTGGGGAGQAAGGGGENGARGPRRPKKAGGGSRPRGQGRQPREEAAPAPAPAP